MNLTLQDAVALALKQNPYVVLANLDVAQTRQDQAIARSSLLPQAAGNVSESAHRLNIDTAFGTGIPGFAQHIGPFWASQSGIEASASIFDLTLWRRYRAAQSGVTASQARETTAREQAVILVVSQYLGSQRAAAELAAAQSRVDLAQALYNQAADLQKNGAGTGIDTLRANVQLQNEKQRLITSQTQLDTSLYALVRLLNIDAHRTITLADQVSFFETPDTPATETIEQAWAGRPELRQLAAQQQQLRLEAQSAGEERLPKLTFSAFWLEQGLTPDTVIPVYQYQFSLDFPLFTGGRIQAARTKANLAIRQLQQQEQDLRNRIAQEVKTALSQLEAARHEVTVANLGVNLAREEVTQARDRFQAGVANNIEVVTAQDELARASDNQIAALYRFNQARADLAHATGRMETLYAR